MASTSETGHAKNVANFGNLISYVSGYGTTYNPSKASIKLPALNTRLTGAKTALNSTNAAMAAYKNSIYARSGAFKPLSELVTRVLNAIKATDTAEQVDETANSIGRKIKGVRATPGKTKEEKLALAAKGKELKEISSSQMSFDSRLENFDKLIKFLSSIPVYTPNEAGLKVTALIALYNDLKAKNTAVVNAIIILSNARIKRNDLLYKLNTGLVDTALDVKTYIKSVFGVSSPQYKQISGIKFKTEKL
jgi:hypothetical protein